MFPIPTHGKEAVRICPRAERERFLSSTPKSSFLSSLSTPKKTYFLLFLVCTYDIGDKLQCFEIFDDVTRSIRNDYRVEVVHRLENESHTWTIYKRVLLATIRD